MSRPDNLPIVGSEWVIEPYDEALLRHVTVVQVSCPDGPWMVSWRIHGGRESGFEALEAFLDAAIPRSLWETLQRPARRFSGPQIAQAWHDVTCPQAKDCPDRTLHMLGAPMVTSGVLQRFLDELGAA